MSDLPRLLLCSFDVIPAPTGSSRRVTEYLRGLSDHFNVVGLTAKTPDHSHIEKYQGARLLRVPVGTGDLLSKLQTFDRAVRRQLESEEYAVVHFTDPFGGYAIAEQRETYGYKLVYDAQTFPSQELRFTHPQLEGDRKFLAKVRRQELFCLMNADRVITGSEVTRELIQSLGVSPENLEVLRAPVDLEPYTEAAMGPPDAAPMRVVYLGSQVGWQGLPTLLRAMQHALREVDVRLVVVGPSHTAWQPLLDDLVEELKLGGKVEFQPPVAHDDLHKVLAVADVGVLPLEDLDRNRVQGGAASKVGEYLAAGRPVIASDLPMAREVLTEEVALFHEPGDPEDIGDCLVALAKNPKRRIRMGKAAFALARRQHDGKVIRERIRQIYSELTGLAASVRREDDEEAGGPAPTLIGTPMSHALAQDTPATHPVPKESAPVPEPRSASSRRKGGTDPAIRPGAVGRTSSGKSSADKRRERRRRRREDVADESASATHPAAHRDEQQVVMGTPLRDDGTGTDPNAASNDEPQVVLGTPLRDPVESRSTEPAASLSREPQVVMGTPLREPAEAPPSNDVAPEQHVLPQETPGATRPAAGSVVFAVGTPLEEVPQPKPQGASVVFAVGTPLEAVPQPRLPPEAVSKPLVSGTPLETLPQPKLPGRVAAPAVVVTTSSKVSNTAAPPRTATDAASVVIDPELLEKPASGARSAAPTVRLPVPPVGTAAASTDAKEAPAAASTVSPAAASTAASKTPELSAPAAAPPPIPSPAATPPPLTKNRAADLDGPEEIDPGEVLSADDDGPAEVSPDDVIEAAADQEEPGPGSERPTGAHPTTQDAERTTAPPQLPPPQPPAPIEAAAPSSSLDAWFAQLVHGYCPPEGAQFARPTPPTNFPGREGPPPATVQPGAPPAQSISSRSSEG